MATESRPEDDAAIVIRNLERLVEIGHEDWKTPGHPMNEWVGRDAVNCAAREALGAFRRLLSATSIASSTVEDPGG